MAKFLNKNVKNIRYKRKISQQYLADKAGIDRSTISRIENNEIDTTIDNAIKIADALNINLSDLLCKDLASGEFKTKDELEELFVKYKDILTDDDRETIKFVFENRLKKFNIEREE